MKGSSDIFTATKLADSIKQKFPGAKKIAIIMNVHHMTQTKMGNVLTRPIGILINKKQMNIDETCDILEIESLTLSIKASQYRYMKARPSYIYWSLVINCEKKMTTIHEENVEYYPSSLFFVNDQSFIESMLPKAHEFDPEQYLDEE